MTRDTQGFPYRKAPFVWAHDAHHFIQLHFSATIHVAHALELGNFEVMAICGQTYYRHAPPPRGWYWNWQGTLDARRVCPDCAAVVREIKDE